MFVCLLDWKWNVYIDKGTWEVYLVKGTRTAYLVKRGQQTCIVLPYRLAQRPQPTHAAPSHATGRTVVRHQRVTRRVYEANFFSQLYSYLIPPIEDGNRFTYLWSDVASLLCRPLVCVIKCVSVCTVGVEYNEIRRSQSLRGRRGLRSRG